jgi:hypothetical protein
MGNNPFMIETTNQLLATQLCASKVDPIKHPSSRKFIPSSTREFDLPSGYD